MPGVSIYMLGHSAFDQSRIHVMKIVLFCLLGAGLILSGCNSRTLGSHQGADFVEQTASTRKAAGKRNDPPARLDLGEAQRALNDYRRRYGLEPLKFNPLLQKAAAAHAAELSRYSRVSHTGRNGSNPAQRVRAAGYRWSSVGENVSAGRMSIAEVIKAWHKSPPHRKNLQLRRAVDFGMAVSHDPDSVLSNYWVLVVAAPERARQGKMSIGFGGRDQ